MFGVKGAHRSGFAGDQRRRNPLGEFQNRQFLRVVAQGARAVENARAFSLGLLQQVGGVEVFAVKGRILAHHDGIELVQSLHFGGFGGEPVLRFAGQADAPGLRLHDPAALPHQLARLAGAQAVAPALGFAHHGKGGVLVGLEGLQRVGNEKQVHRAGLGSKMQRAAAARFLDQHSADPGQQAPKGGADAGDHHAAERDQKGDDGGLALAAVF